MSYPDATDNSWHLYKHALSQLEGYELVWLVSCASPRVTEKILKCNQGSNKNTVSVVKKWSLRGLHKFICAKIVFHTHGTYFFVKAVRNSPIIVNLWHGMPIKAIAALDGKTGSDICYSHYSIATSEPYRSVISNAFNIPLKNVLATGLPRNDVLHTGVSVDKKAAILKTFSNNKDSNLVIWLPTYRVSAVGDIRVDGNNASFIQDLAVDFLYETNQLLLKENLILVIKLHPMDSMCVSSGEYEFSNIRLYDAKKWQDIDLELYDVISVAKGLVSDFSSVMIDCLSTDIPVGFIKSSHSNYNRKLVVPIEELKQCITAIEKPEDIINMIKQEKSQAEQIDLFKKIEFFNSFGADASNKIINKFF